jgi:UDP-3-O-[3-hydroxymyristoyl] glucosamine N-acyltransferase
VSYLSGTPLLNIYLRLMGAKIGRNVFLQSDNFAVHDLLSIGENSSVNSDAEPAWVLRKRREAQIGHVRVGKGCLIGTRADFGRE